MSFESFGLDKLRGIQDDLQQCVFFIQSTLCTEIGEKCWFEGVPSVSVKDFLQTFMELYVKMQLTFVKADENIIQR